ncbi:copper chaperone PCu(A)C [Gemmobacter sp. 24YEA27]|uniref:copper chaperone PCu(A)C n=1 Tax=Gemmobacter sp. 24YEA27 TaxID=3040672 RepID=UPI0024B352AC|nr:copper chaperone PCu(A)C [Gemmobacter sp. 24YEA27]
MILGLFRFIDREFHLDPARPFKDKGAGNHVPVLEIPAGETVALERGGYHIMFMGLKQSLKKGEMVPGTLVFERAGRIEVEFSIDEPKEAEDHSGH